jgi:Zn-dependent M28 family amino/carboxypeptidase
MPGARRGLKTALMLNLDMVGRLRSGRLYVGGVDSGLGLRQLVTDAVRELPLSVELRGSPWSSSDHSSFYRAGRPVLFFFTGLHGDYHRPGDTWDKINAGGLASVTALAARRDAVAAVGTPPVRAIDPRGSRACSSIAPA